MAARPGRHTVRRDGMPERTVPEPNRSRGASMLHLLELPDPGHELLLARYDAVMEEALRRLEAAFLDAGGDWVEQMRAALAHLLALAAANPELTRLATIEIFEAGQPGLDRRDDWMLRFMGLCETGYAQSGLLRPPTELMGQVVVGAVFELIRSHATEDRLDQLSDALPTATLIVLSPIIGRDAALQAAG